MSGIIRSNLMFIPAALLTLGAGVSAGTVAAETPPRAHPAPLHIPVGAVQPRLTLPAGLATAFSLPVFSTRVAQADTSQPPGEPAISQEASTADLEATALYRLGLYLVTQGRFEEARATFEKLRDGYPDSEAAARAKTQLAQLEVTLATQRPIPCEPVPAPPATGATDFGRAEFMVSQTLMAGLAAELLIFAIEPNDDKPYFIAPMVGMFAGLGASYLYSKSHNISTADAMAFYWSQYFMGLNSTLWYLTFSQEDDSVPEAMLSGIVLGTGLGWILSDRLDLDEGDTSVVVTSGLWAGPLTFLAVAALFDNPDEALISGAPAFVTDVAVAGALSLVLSQDIKISRGRTRLITLGGLVGLATAAATVAVIDPSEERVWPGGLALGSVAGLGVGFLATQGWDRHYHPEWYSQGSSRPSLLAYEHGKVMIGSPVPQLTWERRSSAQSSSSEGELAASAPAYSPRVSLSLASGAW